MIRILVADDHPLVLQGLRAIISIADDVTVVAEASNGRDAVLQAIEHHPDVAVIDLDMPELHGIEATKQIRAESPSTAVIVLTMFDDDHSVIAALQAGAAGYLLKGADGDHVLTAIRAAAAGTSVLSPQLISSLARSDPAPSPTEEHPFPSLTARERNILLLVAGGLTNAEIGDQLHLSAKTIANNISMILTRLQVTNRAQAIVLAREAGLVPEPRRTPPNR